ncbi:hypothetical protein M422DRAFT_253924 [Sphaerobolus stellatus SS14]|uniref:Uncharacterized protein n=1 Tax=Sphaerobolus stellatus (strain SS14) TaxID=990650 RepID=A0A0C9VWT8_SPHS4|nr:hypothetical protein M422DRAFT_253924 [Sphaerobolus stellatus SS14]
MQESRNLDAVREWLDTRINEGFNQKAIKAMLRMSSEELAELKVDNTSLPYSIKISAQDIYNTVRRKAKHETILAPEIGESVKLWMEQLRGTGWSTLYELTPGEEGCSGYTLAFVSPWQKKLIGEYAGTAWEKNITSKITFKGVHGKEARAELLKDLRDVLE